MTSHVGVLVLVITIFWLTCAISGQKQKPTSKSTAVLKTMTSRQPLKSRTRVTSATVGLRTKTKSRHSVDKDSADIRLDNVYVEPTKAAPIDLTTTLTMEEKKNSPAPSSAKISRTKPAKNSQRSRIGKTSTMLSTVSPTTSTEVTRRRPEMPKKSSDVCRDQCDTTLCVSVAAESCHGRVVKDDCNCCPVCDVKHTTSESSLDIPGQQVSHQSNNNVCESLTCPKNKVCILNIQGIPMCRCPNVYGCKNADKIPICSVDGVTYKNKCFLKAEECVQSRKLRIAHKGPCRTTPNSPASPDGVANQQDQQTTEAVPGRHSRKMATTKSKKDYKEKQKLRQTEKTKSSERRNNKKRNFD